MRKTEEEENKFTRYKEKLTKFKHFEDRRKNHQIIDEMIQGDKNETPIPKSGEFFLMKTKNYKDNSLALKIPLTDLLDGTKTAEELKRKYGKRRLRPIKKKLTIYEQQERQVKSTEVNFFEKEDDDPDDEIDEFTKEKYEAVLTKDLGEILSKQQKQFLSTSSKVFSDTNTQLNRTTKTQVGDASKITGRPISAKVLIKRNKKFIMRRNKNKGLVGTKSVVHVSDMNEVSVMGRVKRETPTKKVKKRNTFVVKNANRLPDGISGYRAVKIRNGDGKKKNDKFSPFLRYPMLDEKAQVNFSSSKNTEDSKFFSLEFYMFPAGEDKEDLEEMYERIKGVSDDGRVFGYSKYFDLKGDFEWKRCELINFLSDNDLFEIKWPRSVKTKKVTRSNFYFEKENEKQYRVMVENARYWRRVCCIFLKYHDIINHIDTPTNKLQDNVKDKVFKLAMDIYYKLCPPRNPIKLKRLCARKRFDFADYLKNKPGLNIPRDNNFFLGEVENEDKKKKKDKDEGRFKRVAKSTYDIILHFSHKGYNLKTLNKIIAEMEREFIKANHRIEFDSTLPFSKERQKMFRGYLDDEVFEDSSKNIRPETTRMGIPFETMTHNEFLSLFQRSTSILHQANNERQNIMAVMSQHLVDMDRLYFLRTEYQEDLNPENFLRRMDFASQDCFRRVNDIIAELNNHTLKIVNRELDEMKKRNEMVEKKFTIEKERLANIQKELSHQVVTMISRFQRLLNFKLEYRMKLLLRRSYKFFNQKLENVLEKYKRLMEIDDPGFEFDDNLDYEQLLEYQMRTQYEEFDQSLPCILLKMRLKSDKINFGDGFKGFDKKIKNFVNSNIQKIADLRCLTVKEIGPARESKGNLVIQDEADFIKEHNIIHQDLIDKNFKVLSCFYEKVKQFNFVFSFKKEKLKQRYKDNKFKPLRKDTLRLKRAREESKRVFFKNRLKVGLFEIDCKDFRKMLNEHINTIIAEIIDLLIDKISNENKKLSQDVDDIKVKLRSKVKNLKELEHLRSYAKNIEDELKIVMKKINDIMSKLDLVEEMQHRISEEQFNRSWSALGLPNTIRDRANRTIITLEKREKELDWELRETQAELDIEIANINTQFDKLTKINSLEETDLASREFSSLGNQIDKALQAAYDIGEGERILNKAKPTDYSALEDLKKTFNPYFDFWLYAANHSYKYLQRFEGPIGDINRDDFTNEVIETSNELFKMEKNEFKLVPHMLKLCRKLRQKYNELKPFLPLINDLLNPDLKARHWNNILNTLGIKADENEVKKITFRTFLDRKARENLDEIRDISEMASKEHGFVKVVGTLKNEWKKMKFEIGFYRDSGKLSLKNMEPIFDKLDEDIAKLSSILSSPNVKFLENDILSEKQNLINIQDTIDIWLKLQKHWQYLQPIFSSDDIKSERQEDAQKYASIDNSWSNIMEATKENPGISETCRKHRLFEQLEDNFIVAEKIIKSLNDYLNSKRAAFPRFFFLPNEELLTILAETRQVRRIQKFLPKCFEGIHRLTFTDDNVITHMNSNKQEFLEFNEAVDPNLENNQVKNVEVWLTSVEDQMKETLATYYEGALESFDEAKKSSWIFEWPSQIVLTVGQTLWTMEVDKSIEESKTNPNSLKEAYNFQKEKLMKIVNLTQSGGTKAKKDVMTLEVLIIMEVHGLDVIEDLQKVMNLDVDSFEWVSQLRYYYKTVKQRGKPKRQALMAVMINTEREYGWEYIGNQGRLVITPLTDRCYRTLMSALQMNLGGAPEGPAGTGKTETVKDLAKALAKQCVVFNCSDELDISQMSKFFRGLTSCGSWACFDEFNLIELDVLSVIAQQISTIQNAIIRDSSLKTPTGKFRFQGTEVALDSTCAIFITMNPGYAGRSELPDNLKRLFRSISMIVADFSIIAEISLYSYGFKDARNLSVKIVQSLRLSSEQLSTQSHYDYGMRSVKTILRSVGDLKRRFPGEQEAKLVIKAICDSTIPKFTSGDIVLFKNILNDLFPGQERMNFDYGNLEYGIKRVVKDSNLSFHDTFKLKIIQLYETIKVRHGLMIVGNTYSGKTSILNSLLKGWELGGRVTQTKSHIEEGVMKFIYKIKEKEHPVNMNTLINLISRTKRMMGNNPSIADQTMTNATQTQETHESKSELSREELDQVYLDLIEEYVMMKLEETLTSEIIDSTVAETKIQLNTINPKSISIQQMYGEVVTDEWKEGIAAKIFKECADDLSGDLRWITFDGPVDAGWIESMNTVLDDNKKLCLPNSEQIKMTDKMSVIFEVEDLAEASLATVSRCGMVYMEASQLPLDALYYRWFEYLPSIFKTQKHKEFFDIVYNNIFTFCLSLVKNPSIKKVSEVNEHHLLDSTLKIFESFFFRNRNREDIQKDLEFEKEREEAKKKVAMLIGEQESAKKSAKKLKKKKDEFGKNQKGEIFAAAMFAVTWGFGSIVDSASRESYSSMISSELKTQMITSFKDLPEEYSPPEHEEESLYDCYYAFDTKNWQPYIRFLNRIKLTPEMNFSDIFIPTKDSIRNEMILKLLVKQQYPVLFFGKTGTGKTQIVKKYILEELDPNKFIPLITVLSANTQRGQLQDVLESKLEKQKRARGIFGPVVGKKNIIYIDDLNMPKKGIYNSQPPLELIRQWLDNGGWYDRKLLEFKKIVDIQIVSSMGVGRPDIPRRLFRHFNVQYIFEYDEETIEHVFKNIVNHTFMSYPDNFKAMTRHITNISVSIYNYASSEFLPLPGKSHYLFNLRDLSKVIQGILLVPDEMIDPKKLFASYAKLIHFEACRVFSDRFVTVEDKRKFDEKVKKIIEKNLRKSWLDLVPQNESFYIFGNFYDIGGVSKVYQEINDKKKLKEVVEKYITQFNELSKIKIDILLFDEALQNLAKINRIISREYGHALLVGLGGDGRRTLTRLASHMQGFACEEPDIKKDMNKIEWQDFMKDSFKMTGVDENRISLLVTDAQLHEDIFYEDINNILNIGEMPNLHSADDKEAIISELKQKYSKKKSRKKNLSSLAVWEEFLKNCKNNLHLVLCVSPIGDTLRLRMRNFPSLINCSSIIWHLPWNKGSLKTVAHHTLYNDKGGASSNELLQGKEETICDIFVEFHKSVQRMTEKYYNSTGKRYYVTPINYQNLLQSFLKLLEEKQTELVNNRDQYKNGVQKLDECAIFVEDTKKKLENLEPELSKKSIETTEAIKEVDKKKEEAEATRMVVEEESKKAQDKKKIAESIKAECDEKLAIAEPGLLAAKKLVQNLEEKDFVEIKSYKEPPTNIVIIFQGTLRLLGKMPKKKKDQFKQVKEQMKTLLKNPKKFLNKLRNFEVKDISKKAIVSLKEFMDTQPKFNIKTATTASGACGSMCKWVFAFYDYYNVYHEILPLRNNLKVAEESLKAAQDIVDEKLKLLAAVEERVANLEAQLQIKKEEKSKLERNIRECTLQLDRAVKLNKGLSGERGRWSEQVIILNQEIENVLGDIILACASLSYIGPFTLEFRKKLIKEEFVPTLTKAQIFSSGEKFSLTSLVGDPVTIQSWNFCGLPFDETSTENILIMKYNKKIPLVVDPQKQFLKFIKKHVSIECHDMKKKEVIYKANVSGLETKLISAIRMGTTMILENVGENINAVFDGILSGKMTMSGGVKCVTVGTQLIQYDRYFQLYLVSNLNTPHYTPETLSRVTYLDFSITPSGLKDQMLSLICRQEKPKDEDDKIMIMRENTENKQKQKETEEKILMLLRESGGNVVEDDVLVNSLTESKVNAEEIKVRLKMSEQTQEKIDKNRNNYEPLASLATNIFLIINELDKWDPMYQFSLKWFENIFLASIKETPKDTKEVEERVTKLKKSIMVSSFREICRSLFVKHKQLFAFLLSITTLKTDNELDTRLWNLLLTEKGISIEAKEDASLEENPIPHILSDVTWRKVYECSKNPHFSDMAKMVAENGDYFKDFVNQMENEDKFVEEYWPRIILPEFSKFKALTLIKIFRADLFQGYMSRFIQGTIGEEFTRDILIPIETTYVESNPTIPLLYILAPGDDPYEDLKKFASELSINIAAISLGKGQGKNAEDNIYECCQKRMWVLLQNCHLAVSWLPQLEIIIERLRSSEYAKKINTNFRLFLTAASIPDFPLSILQSSIKMTKDPPKGIKANIQEIYQNQSSTKAEKQFFEQVPEEKEVEWRKLYMSLSFFHAIVRERRRYGPVGWNIPYDFNESDFKISIKQLKFILENYKEIPYKALNYLTSQCYYGGKVTEKMDAILLIELLKDFFNPEVSKEERYQFSPKDYYFIPKKSLDLIDTLDFIEKLPDKNEPELYGLHSNAAISSAINDTKNMISDILLINPKDSSGLDVGAQNKELELTAKGILSKIPMMFDEQKVRETNPISYDNCMNTVLIQEVLRYNTLIECIRTSLDDLIKACQGVLVMTDSLEKLAESVRMNLIPVLWQKKSYPSTKPLSSYVDDFIKRIKMFQSWSDSGAPIMFWVPGFFFTQSFFTGVLQQYARKTKISIDELEFDHKVMSENYTPARSPEEGCFINGLYLEAGRWNSVTESLAESEPKIIYSNMPPIKFIPRRKKKAEENPEENKFAVKSKEEKKDHVYNCPLYKTTLRWGTLNSTGHSTNYILAVNLKSKVKPAHWIKRGTALLTQLND